MTRLAAVLLAATALACASAPRPFPPPPTAIDDAAAREVLGRFARALEAGRFDEAHALLSARWKQAYTPGRLALDFRGGGGARDAAARVLRALSSGEALVREGASARLREDGGRAAVLVAEAGGWRVDALE